MVKFNLNELQVDQFYDNIIRDYSNHTCCAPPLSVWTECNGEFSAALGVLPAVPDTVFPHPQSANTIIGS